MLDTTEAGGPAALDGTERKRRGAFYTPPGLVDRIVEAVVGADLVARVGDRPVRVLDPSCGDGRFLLAVRARLASIGARSQLVGVDLDPLAAAEAGRNLPGATIHRDDALARDWADDRFDLVIGNPPFLSQLATATSRGRASGLGGGPYADVAVEFLALAARLVDPRHGRVAFVLPQSVLSSRDAGEVRARYDERATMIWSSWSDERQFDANVYTCALAFEFGGGPATDAAPWSHVVTTRRQVPSLPAPATDGTVGDRARLNANFRDEYYGMIPAVGDHADGPPLITSGLIDPGHCRWGARPVTFARRRFTAPRVDVGALDDRMRRWARERLVPKVLVANQTRVVEAVCDPVGAWLPAVPVVAAYPAGGDPAVAWQIAAVLTSPYASAWAWHRNGGTGLSAATIRLGPVVLADVPWPGGSLDEAAESLRAGDVRGCGAAVHRAYGVTGDDGELTTWWTAALDRLEARR